MRDERYYFWRESDVLSFDSLRSELVTEPVCPSTMIHVEEKLLPVRPSAGVLLAVGGGGMHVAIGAYHDHDHGENIIGTNRSPPRVCDDNDDAVSILRRRIRRYQLQSLFIST
jgi:hypothetical protein